MQRGGENGKMLLNEFARLQVTFVTYANTLHVNR